jgi:hypothetical protein
LRLSPRRPRPTDRVDLRTATGSLPSRGRRRRIAANGAGEDLYRLDEGAFSDLRTGGGASPRICARCPAYVDRGPHRDRIHDVPKHRRGPGARVGAVCRRHRHPRTESRCRLAGVGRRGIDEASQSAPIEDPLGALGRVPDRQMATPRPHGRLDEVVYMGTRHAGPDTAREPGLGTARIAVPQRGCVSTRSANGG